VEVCSLVSEQPQRASKKGMDISSLKQAVSEGIGV